MPPAKEDKVCGLSLGEWDPPTLICLAEEKTLNKVGKGDEVLNQAILKIHWDFQG